ncbi:hypothetical protein H0H93_005578 [Arthromyces matolae]|nr:hypothetical protein H0H93_005578 [Arthromyces matolae]
MSLLELHVIFVHSVDSHYDVQKQQSASSLLHKSIFVSRASKDSPSAENTDARHESFLAVSELFVFGSCPIPPHRKQLDDSRPTHIAKAMFGRNPVPTLTTGLSVSISAIQVYVYVTLSLIPTMLDHWNICMTRTKNLRSRRVGVDGQNQGYCGWIQIEMAGKKLRISTAIQLSGVEMYGSEMDGAHHGGDNGMDELMGEEDVKMDFGDDSGSEDISHDEDEVDEEATKTLLPQPFPFLPEPEPDASEAEAEPSAEAPAVEGTIEDGDETRQ